MLLQSRQVSQCDNLPLLRWCEIAQCLLRWRLPLCVAAGCGGRDIAALEFYFLQKHSQRRRFVLVVLIAVQIAAQISQRFNPPPLVATVWLSAVAGPCDKIHQASQWWQGLLAAVLVCARGPVAHFVVAGAAVCPVVLLLCRWPPPRQGVVTLWAEGDGSWSKAAGSEQLPCSVSFVAAFGTDGLVVFLQDRSLAIWRKQSGGEWAAAQTVAAADKVSHPVTAAAFCESAGLCFGCADGSIAVYSEAQSAILPLPASPHTSAVRAVVALGDGRFASSSDECNLCVSQRNGDDQEWSCAPACPAQAHSPRRLTVLGSALPGCSVAAAAHVRSAAAAARCR